MNKKLHSNRKFISALLASVYLFAVFFSGVFHSHGKNFKQDISCHTAKIITNKTVDFGGLDNCFSSHYYNAGIGVIDSVPYLEIIFNFFINTKSFLLKDFVITETILFFSLRAPPFDKIR